jgi:predicted phosphodiesterase
MRAARGFKPEVVVHMGDLADMFTVSSHSKDPSRLLTLKDELVLVRKLRAQMESLAPRRMVFVEGNHEDRLRRYLQDKAPELFGLVSADELIGLSKNGWEFTGYKDYAKVGKLHVTHDTGHSGKYTTARALETFQASVVIGHHHAIGFMVGGDAKGKHQVAAQFGWLGDIRQIDYMHRVKAMRNWSLGFGTGYRSRRTNVVYLTPHPIVNYSACVEGRVYSA